MGLQGKEGEGVSSPPSFGNFIPFAGEMQAELEYRQQA